MRACDDAGRRLQISTGRESLSRSDLHLKGRQCQNNAVPAPPKSAPRLSSAHTRREQQCEKRDCSHSNEPFTRNSAARRVRIASMPASASRRNNAPKPFWESTIRGSTLTALVRHRKFGLRYLGAGAKRTPVIAKNRTDVTGTTLHARPEKRVRVVEPLMRRLKMHKETVEHMSVRRREQLWKVGCVSACERHEMVE